jgi:pyridinium-3,5-biscarboxylic acid mononucleotide sulfurtransferase
MKFWPRDCPGAANQFHDVKAMTSEALMLKYDALREGLRPRLQRGLIVAFSGGVDSAFLLWSAEQERRAAGGRLLAVTAVSASLPEAEREDAEEFARNLGVEHRWETSEELSDPNYLRNDGLRCYHCKTELFRLTRIIMQGGDYEFVAYGFNASDRGDLRPGHQAALENGVLAPLADAELTKDEIRALMRVFKLPLADKPSSPCLSSRLMTGVAVTPEKLRDVEAMESILRAHGIDVARVRVHEEGQRSFLRIEVGLDEMEGVLAARDELLAAGVARGYQRVLLDLAGYRMGGAVVR